jgi:hypothetical protein
LLRQRKAEATALIAAMPRGASISECVRAIEEA